MLTQTHMTTMTEPVESSYLHSLQWASSQGISVRKVAPTEFHGRGLGMVATRVIEVSLSARYCHFNAIDVNYRNTRSLSLFRRH